MNSQRCTSICGKQWIFVLATATLILTFGGIFHEDLIYLLGQQEAFSYAEGRNINRTLDYIIPNVDVCGIHPPHLLIWIYSAPDNSARRNAIRNTWGNITLYQPVDVRVVFSLAKVLPEVKQEKVFQEQKLFGDLVQDGSFVDAYRNLTYKAQSMLIWTDKYCSGVKLLLKVDDDTFISPKRVTSWLNEWRLQDDWPSNAILGIVWRYPTPIRRSSKWLTTEKEWPDRVFAKKGCPGGGYFITGDAVPKLRDAVDKVRFLWIEDMYVTGVLAQRAHVHHIDISSHIYFIYDETAFDYVTSKDRYFLVTNIPRVTVHYQLLQALYNSSQRLKVNLFFCALPFLSISVQ